MAVKINRNQTANKRKTAKRPSGQDRVFTARPRGSDKLKNKMQKKVTAPPYCSLGHRAKPLLYHWLKVLERRGAVKSTRQKRGLPVVTSLNLSLIHI